MCDLFRPQTDTFTYTTNFGCKKQTPFQIFRPVAPLSAHARYAYVLAMIKQPFLFFLIYIFVDILAGVVGTALLLKAIMSICLLVRRSVCHTGEPRLSFSGSKYRNTGMFHTMRESDVCVFDAKFCIYEFRRSPRMSALKRGTSL